MIGQYQPFAPGARTLREARPLFVGHDLVTVHVYEHEGAVRLAIFVGIKMPYDGPLPDEITEARHVNPYVQRFIAEYTA